jgi:hypothetical protein
MAVNQFRLQRGLYPLASNSLLDSAAAAHSQDMSQNNFFSHTGSDGSTMGQRLLAAGYNYTSAREDLAAGQENAALILADWSASPAHLPLLTDPGLTEAGVGYVYDPADQANVRLDNGQVGGPYCFYWTLDAATRAGVYPVTVNGGATEVASRQVTVAIPGTMSLQVRFANQPQWAGVPWQSSAPAIPFQLLPGDGPKTVYGQVLLGGVLIVDAIPATVSLYERPMQRAYLPLIGR